MKKLFTLAVVALFTMGAFAQIKTPAPSPSSKLDQTIGLTEVSVEYARPSMKGRTIFGNLVPYDKIWRAGANARTKITFSTDVTIGSKPLKAGSYAIFVKPTQNAWTVYFYTEADGWGAPQDWDDDKVAAAIQVPVIPMPMDIETFTITFDDLTANGGNLGLLWENAYVGVPIGVPTDATVMANIKQVMNGPSAGDYYAAAVYLSSQDKDLGTAKEYMDKAMSMIETPRFWQLRQQSLILAKNGDKAGAIKAAQASLAGAKEAGNTDYVKLNTDSLKEWGAM